MGGRGSPHTGWKFPKNFLRGAGAAGSFWPPCGTLEKGPKGLQNDQETCTAVVKRAKVKSYQVLLESRQAKCPLESEFAQGFRMIFIKNGFHLEGFLATQNEKKGIPFHFFAISFTERFHFCFKKPNNFHSGRKVEKRTKIRVENVVHVLKGCNGFIFNFFTNHW